MRTIEQLRDDFAIYTNEIERCEKTECYLALLHILLALPDVCARLETDPASKKEGGDLYVEWCAAYFPKNSVVSGADRYQMRNSLLHSGSTTAQNRFKKHPTIYAHFSFVDSKTFDIPVHNTTNPSGRVINVDISAMATETKDALERWFNALQGNSIKMSQVDQNIGRLIRLQPKRVIDKQPNGSQAERIGLTRSST